MTGELTLSGRILPIGGVKEKVLAARRAGVTSVLLPERNRENLAELEADLRAEIEVELVDSLHQAVEYTLLPVRPGSSLRPEPARSPFVSG